MIAKIAENIYSVGAVDYDIREFHGYLTPVGTSYNAYLITDEKTVLIDSVKAPFSDVLIENIKEIIDPSKIDIIISNHVEPDHSGGISAVLEYAKNAVVYTSINGQKGLSAYYGGSWNMKAVKSLETISSGKYSYTFLHTPMVHWPDNMVTFMNETGLLFSNDAFGQHIAEPHLFTDEINPDFVMERAADYYANIVLPFGMQVSRVLEEALKLDIKMILPSHGLVWRQDIDKIAAKYTCWANNETNDKKAVIVYETMWGTTEEIANNLCADLEKDGIKASIYNLRDTHISTVMADLIDAEYIYVGSPTLNRGVMPKVAGFLCYMKGLSPKNRKGRAFGAYGWSGESADIIEATMKDLGFNILDKIKIQYKI